MKRVIRSTFEIHTRKQSGLVYLTHREEATKRQDTFTPPHVVDHLMLKSLISKSQAPEGFLLT